NGLSSFFPLYLKAGTEPAALFAKPTVQSALTPNVSKLLGTYLGSLGTNPLDLFLHCVAVLHAPSYRSENAGALRIDWPRIPLPDTKVALQHSGELGRDLSALLDVEAPVKGVTSGS